MKEINKILLRRKNKIILNKNSVYKENNLQSVASILANMESLGYLMSRELIHELMYLNINELVVFERDIISELKESIGYKEYNPMYPDFPLQVMKMDDVELYINAILHYISNGEILPQYESKIKFPLINNSNYKVIDIANEDDIKNIFNNLINSKTSLSATDKKDLGFLFREYCFELPDVIPFKENIAIICGILVNIGSAYKSVKYLKTPTDVLRVITYMSGGDISLHENTKFKSMKRKHRRLFLEILNGFKNPTEDMLKHKNKWIRVGEILHPREYKQFSNINNSFDILRNNLPYATFNRNVEIYIKNRKYKEAIDLLSTKPGELARKLDYLLRENFENDYLLDVFESVANNISSTVLLQVLNHFRIKTSNLEYRLFFPKGNVANGYCIENNLKIIPTFYIGRVILICIKALSNIYKEREEMGKVYISKKYENYLIPFSQRTASKALKTIVRGSKIDIDKTTNFIRPFIYWQNTENERVDIDLSAIILDENWNKIKHISYTNLKSNSLNCCHSGDITNAPDGASEFINIDIEKVKQNNGRYVLFEVFSYSKQAYCDLPQCYFGFMERDNDFTGEVYEPSTVKNKIDLAVNSSVSIPVVFDIVERKFIWLDLNCNSHKVMPNNLESNSVTIDKIVKSFVGIPRINLYDLIYLNADSRGTIVKNKEKADIIFDIDEGITPFDTEEFMGKYI